MTKKQKQENQRCLERWCNNLELSFERGELLDFNVSVSRDGNTVHSEVKYNPPIPWPI